MLPVSNAVWSGRYTVGHMDGIPEKVEVALTSDVLAFYVGQDVLLKQLLAEANKAPVASLATIQSLRRRRAEVRELLSEAGVEALVNRGIPRERLLRAEVRVLQDSAEEVRIVGIAYLTTKDESC